MKINERLIFRAVWILLGLTSCDKAERRHGQRGGADAPPALPCAEEGEAAVKPPETRGKAGLRGCRFSRASQGTDPRHGTDPGQGARRGWGQREGWGSAAPPAPPREPPAHRHMAAAARHRRQPQPEPVVSGACLRTRKAPFFL